MDKEEMRLDFDKYIAMVLRSDAYSAFARDLYGYDLKLINMLDRGQLERILDEIARVECGNILDVGCGTGDLLCHVAKLKKCGGLGIDFTASPASNPRFSALRGVSFRTLDIENLADIEGTYSVILAIDSLFTAEDIDGTIRDILRLREPGGTIIIAFSEYGFDERGAGLIRNGDTRIDVALRNAGIPYVAVDATADELRYWESTLELANKHKDLFVAEGSAVLCEGRLEEASYIIDMIRNGNSKRAIYLIRGS